MADKFGKFYGMINNEAIKNNLWKHYSTSKKRERAAAIAVILDKLIGKELMGIQKKLKKMEATLEKKTDKILKEIGKVHRALRK